MYSQGAAAAFGEHLEVSPSLRRLDHAKRVFLAGHRQVSSVVASQLQNHPAVGATFVRLTGGMKKSRTKLQAGGHSLFVTQNVAQFLQEHLMLGVHLDVSQQRKIVAGTRTFNMSTQISRKGFVGARCLC